MVKVIDSHTGGEPTRVVVSGIPRLSGNSIAEQLKDFQNNHDAFRSAVVNEPRGSDAVVGALLLEAIDPTCVAGVIFFNNVGVLGMCVHGTIGLVVTLAHLGRLCPGVHRIETPVGIVTTTLHDNGEVTVGNVPSFRYRTNVEVATESHGTVVGDIAWGGNWFFLARECPVAVQFENIEQLTNLAWDIRQGLNRAEIFGNDGHEVDHIELFSNQTVHENSDSKNFVLCPGKAYDRSPCGTGTSAKLACLHADGQLNEGESWRQESIVGSVFEGSVAMQGDSLIPSIKGSAFINAEALLIFNENDPFKMGIRG